ncbi:MAG TPA: GxxExxY protein [Vicinamibacterales bacterium]|nr:GxxExxY protein [Vicinamibacterales bacterium]
MTEQVIGAAIEVHRALGPGLLESAYEECLSYELTLRDVPFRRQIPLPLVYKGAKLDCGYRLDLLVADALVVEIKTVEHLDPIHIAQVLTYLKMGGWPLGLIFNFNLAALKNGIKRVINGSLEAAAQGLPKA